MSDKFKENFKLVFPAAITTLIIFLVLTFNTEYLVEGSLDYDLLRIVPYALVLITALLGVNVFIVLSLGVVFSLGVGLYFGDFGFLDVFTIVGGGMESMFEITVISITVGAVFGLIKANGGIDFIINAVKNNVKTEKGAQLGIAALSGVTDMATANNTVAIVIAGPIAKEIGDEFGLEPKRVASLLDICTSSVQGIIPYGAQVLTAAGLAGISPVQAIPYFFYPMLMIVSVIGFVLFSKGSKRVESQS